MIGDDIRGEVFEGSGKGQGTRKAWHVEGGNSKSGGEDFSDCLKGVTISFTGGDENDVWTRAALLDVPKVSIVRLDLRYARHC